MATPEPQQLAKYDLFISYAGEDREFVNDMACQLRDRGLYVWYDRFRLKLGDSIMKAIGDGLAQSRYGVIVLSPHYLRKHMPLMELEALVLRGSVILPIYHDITPEQMKESSPLLAGFWGVDTAQGTASVIEAILERVRPELQGVRGIALDTLGYLTGLAEGIVTQALQAPPGSLREDRLDDALRRVGLCLSAIQEATVMIANAESPDRIVSLLRNVRRRVIKVTGGNAYCVKCRERVEMQSPEQITMKNGKPATRGLCPKCGTKVFRVFRIGKAA